LATKLDDVRPVEKDNEVVDKHLLHVKKYAQVLYFGLDLKVQEVKRLLS